ncbi:MAG: helix-turn-helix transcriptional regulator [Treponema sp.]|nr:helix-turn-helix transcriptional regulator [Treponema sp.]
MIKLLREKNRYTQVKLAEQIGISRQALIKYENMELEPPLSVVRSLSKLFSVNYDCFIDNKLSEESNSEEAEMLSQLLKNVKKLNDSEKRAVFEMARIMANS